MAVWRRVIAGVAKLVTELHLHVWSEQRLGLFEKLMRIAEINVGNIEACGAGASDGKPHVALFDASLHDRRWDVEGAPTSRLYMPRITATEDAGKELRMA